MLLTTARVFAAAALLCCSTGWSQTAPKSEPDTLVLTDGEKLIGHLVRTSGTSVRFKSDALGDVNIDWSKIKELHAGGQYAVIPKGVKLKPKSGAPNVPEGTISEGDQKIAVASEAGTKSVAVAETDAVIDRGAFEKAMDGGPGFFHAWHGTVTAGASFVAATQNSRTFTDAIALVRINPGEDWLARRNRTTASFSSSYGLVSQPGSPTLKTSIYHVDAERDEYLSAKFFAFGQGLFDHNFSQGLNLQQTYVGGAGYSLIAKPNESLDLKAGVSYVEQQFAGTAKAMSLAGSVFDEKFLRRFGKGITFTQEFAVSPSWTNSKALSALGNSTLSVPVIKRFTFTVGATDNFLNDPPPGFKRNSFQFTTGLSYVLP
jgi:hypothetical protein